MNLQSVIDKKKEAAEYMVSEITHICKDFEKRDPGSGRRDRAFSGGRASRSRPRA